MLFFGDNIYLGGYMLKAILWDYDGTLVNTTEKNFNVTIKILKEVTGKSADNFKPLSSHEEYLKANQESANWRELYKNHFGLNPKQVDQAGLLWTQFQLEDDSCMQLYDGVYEVLEASETLYHGIISQNSRKNILRVLSQLHIEDLFIEVVGYKEVALEHQKPHPEGVLNCLNMIPHLQDNDLVLYVGDHESDLQSAINANKILKQKRIIFVAAMYEKENRVEHWEVKPDYVATHPSQILELFSRCNEELVNGR